MTPTTRPCVALALALASLAGCRTSTPAAPQGVAAEASAAPVPGIDAAIVDRGADPCEDFYQYACGGWLRQTEIPADQGIWSRSFMEIRERNQKTLRVIADDAAAGKWQQEDRFADKVGAFYASCMDEAAVEARGTRELQALWARIDGVKDGATLAAEVGRLHRAGVWPLFQVFDGQDARDATQVIGFVWQGGLTLPDRDDYVVESERNAKLQASLKQYVETQLALGGLPPEQAKAAADQVLALEKQLAEPQWRAEELRDPERIYNRLELAGLQRTAPAFPWDAYLSALGQPHLTAFSASTPRYLERIDALVRTVPPETWRSYLKFRTAATLAAARALPKAMVDAAFQFDASNFTGAQEMEPRWKHCLDVTDGALGEALGQAWVRRHFGADAKARTNQLVVDVEAAMGRDLEQLAWLDAPTRERANEKLRRIRNKIGYPDRWRDYARLEVSRGDFAANVMAASAFELNRSLSKIGKPVDRGDWLMTPPTVNAYYLASMNEMAFPAGILQPPFYTRGAPDAVNYGAAGMVVGHELTHGFDDEGRRFDAEGNLKDWWTPAVAQEFERRAECVVKQFGEYVADPAVPDVKLNGRLTLGENLADLGGLKLAFSAWQASRRGRGAEAAVAGFAPEQAFFLGYAQSWCTKIRPEMARVRAQIDPHAPPRWRVNGPLSNLPEFRQAFRCEAGQAMVRAERCEVW